jgi:hypothetical protein
MLPPPQLKLWPELGATRESFTLYGGTALTMRLGYRTSTDFDFFSKAPLGPERREEPEPAASRNPSFLTRGNGGFWNCCKGTFLLCCDVFKDVFKD